MAMLTPSWWLVKKPATPKKAWPVELFTGIGRNAQ
jgi:hypothetical protein